MVRTSVRLATVAALVSLAACAPAAPPPPPDTTAEDTAAINALRDAWVAAYNAGDADAVANLYAENAVDLPMNEPTVTGRAGIRASVAARMAMGKGTATVTSEELRLMGTAATDRGTFSVSIVPAAGGEAMTQGGRYLVVLQKQADGSWKLVAGMDNSPTPMPAAGSN